MSASRAHECRPGDLAIRWPDGSLWLLLDVERPADDVALFAAFTRELARRRRLDLPGDAYTHRPRPGELVVDPRTPGPTPNGPAAIPAASSRGGVGA